MKFPRPTITKENGCVYVDGPETTRRYRTLNYEGQRWPAHRLSYHLNVGEIGRCPPTPSTGLVLHDCDDGLCINPEHLHLGTTRQNMLECEQRSKVWKEWVDSLRGKPKSAETRAKLAKAQSVHQQSKTPEERKKAMANVQAVANQYAQTPEAKAKRVASMRKYWDSLGPEGRRKHTRPALKARGI